MSFSSFSVSATMVLLSLLFIFSSSEAKEYLVGGSTDAWKIPSSQSDDSLNQWAKNARLNIGDSLVKNYTLDVFPYESDKDSVLQVSKQSYTNCNKTEPIEEYKNGENTKVLLSRSGPYYFISGAESNCEKGQKVTVVVIHPSRHVIVSPAPSPADFDGPAVAPTSGGVRLGGGLMMMVFGVLVGFALI